MLSNWEKGRECTDGWTKALQTAVPVQTAVDYLQVKGKAVLANIIPPTNHNSLKVLFSCVSLEEVLFSLDVFFCCSTLFSWDRSMVSNPNWSHSAERQRSDALGGRFSDPMASHLRWLAAVGGPVLIQLTLLSQVKYMALFVFRDRPDALLQVHIYLPREKICRCESSLCFFTQCLPLLMPLKRY